MALVTQVQLRPRSSDCFIGISSRGLKDIVLVNLRVLRDRIRVHVFDSREEDYKYVMKIGEEEGERMGLWCCRKQSFVYLIFLCHCCFYVKKIMCGVLEYEGEEIEIGETEF
ncbi:hypothetical protein M5689_003125 [Euphorbia peplus]|nr:hypothetical protein M5689_003125 [Euphorbia peplus]